MESNNELVVVVHDGQFHGDEVTAAVIMQFLAQARGLELKIVRTRNSALIEEWRQKGAYILDVGGLYDGVKNFDHHQKTFSELRSNGKPFATAGLIWFSFGFEVLSYLTKSNNNLLLKKVWNELDKVLFEAVDGRDVGKTTHMPVEGYQVQTVSDIIRECEHFDQALEIAKIVLQNKVRVLFKQISEEELVRDALAPQLNARVVVFQFDHFVDWKSTVVVESPETLLVVFWDGREWKLSSVPVQTGSFESRLLLPSPWRGLSGAEFQTASGFGSGSFCHAAGFIAGFADKQDALDAAAFAIFRLDPDQVV